MKRPAHVYDACRRPAQMLLLSIVLCILSVLAAGAEAMPPGPGWSIQSVAQPANLSPAGGTYVLIVTNIGSQDTRAGAPVTISDTLPSGVRASTIRGEEVGPGGAISCTNAPLQCVVGGVPAGRTVVVTIGVRLEEGVIAPGPVNAASVSGGGAPAATTTETTAFSSQPAPFGIDSFSSQAFEADGLSATQAAGHPYTLATSLYFNSEETGNTVKPVEEVKDVIVDLPLGLVGDPQAVPTCPLSALLQQTEETACPPASRVGTIVFEAAPGSTFRTSEANETTAVYNMQPEPGFPAEFGFTYLGRAVYLYASTVRIRGQLRLRVTVPGIPNLSTLGATLLFYGNPGEHFGEAGTSTPFFTSPADCAAGQLPATAEVDSWLNPASQHENIYSSFAETAAYTRIAGCNVLQFRPSLSAQPEVTQADEPSGYTFTVTNPQNESPVTPGTPELKNATVTLPAGVSISPSAADGLRTCAATGPEGINIGSDETGGAGQDLGDPYATELGDGHLVEEEGHFVKKSHSPYDDGLYHTAPGHCPAASTIGSVEVETHLLPSPLRGHMYVAQPGCGGQLPCTEADALDGNLFGVYLEVSGSGVIVKLAGSVSVNPATGRITATFRENPQVPFSVLRLHLNGGPRAALANPQTCGVATTAGDLSAWSSPATLDDQVFSPFTVDWDGAGGACPADLPLTPSLVAETIIPTAGAFSPFTFSLSRADRQQYLSQVGVTMPPGLLAMISSVALCDEPQAAQGDCAVASEIGTATAAAGPGSHPYWVTGHVYLTTGYRGAPFGLSIVVPARAGPFNLGNVVVRSAVTVDRGTGAVAIVSDRLPQVIDGIPLRVQVVNVNVDRPGFIFNPTSCSAKQIAATVAGARGALVHVSDPFATAGCVRLPFSPRFTASTRGRTSKAKGAGLDVKLLYKPGQANIRSVFVALPKQLPSRLSTIQQACPAATFEADPAACPAGSVIGIAKAKTPVLSVPLIGPAYLVSHGGAAFPDLLLILQGEGVRIDVVGHVNIAKGVTTTNIADAPDAPISSFELSVPEGPHSALTTNLPSKAHGNLCGSKLVMPTTLTGQNGARVRQNVGISVDGCPKAKRKARGATAQTGVNHRLARRDG